MTATKSAVRGLCCLLALSLAGCEEKQQPKARLLPALDRSAAVVLEAEAGNVEPAMVIEEFAGSVHKSLGLRKTSGGRCVSVPKDANAAQKNKPKGTLALTFSVPKDGVYYIHPRTWWKDGCGNSLGMSVDGAPPMLVSDGTYETWHWIKLNPDDFKSDAPRPFKLTKGEHTLTFSNREDDVKLDQVYVTSDPDDRPAGVMTAQE